MDAEEAANKYAMGRYLLFAGETYYAKGGKHDLIGRFARRDEAFEHGSYLVSEHSDSDADWWHVYDTLHGEIIAGSESQALGAPDLEDL